MKKYFTLLLLTLSFFLLFGTVTFGQVKKTFLEGSLWIVGTESSIEKDVPSNVKSEDELNTYFNYNPVVDFSRDKILKEYKNIIKKKSSLFVVFKSSATEENAILSLERGLFKSSLSTKKMLCDKEVHLNKGDSKTGLTLSYLYNKTSLTEKKDGSLIFDDLLYEDKAFKNQLLELIYVPKILNIKEKNVVESYLAIKHGISLNEGQNYYNSKKDTIWNTKENTGFGTRITGIGKDVFFGLNQKQSCNSLQDGLSIGFNKIEKTNAENKQVLLDRTFLIWGDNDGTSLLEQESNSSQKRMKRIWKMQTTAKTGVFNTQLQIDKKLMELGEVQPVQETDLMWLAIDTTQSPKFNYTHAKYIKATVNDDTRIVFDNVKFSANTHYLFTIVQAPDFSVSKDIEKPNCLIGQNGKLNIGIIGGAAPYKINIASKTYNQEVVSQVNHMEIENLSTGSYSMEVTDVNKNSQKSNFIIDSFTEEGISLEPKWYITEAKSVTVIPTVTDEVTDFAWIFQGKVVSREKEFEAEKPGNYTLKIGNQVGCEKELSFEVLEKTIPQQLNYGYVIFPNPVVANANFSIQFNLKEASNVTVQISDLNGKIIKNKLIGTIKNYDFSESLKVSGTYLVLVSINGVVEATKLIVK
ncbi:MAG: T9SS type A sorting domain-containing protein [Bacteroidota bacterium]